MKKQFISIALLATILLQSCVAYQSASLSLDEAKDKGKVKVIRRAGNNSTFKNIHLVDGEYYGSRQNEEILLNVSHISDIHLKDYQKSRSQTKLLVGTAVTLVLITVLVAVVVGAFAINEALPLFLMGI